MRVNIHRELTALTGAPILNPQNKLPLTLGVVLVEALLSPPAQGQKDCAPADKMHRYQTAVKIHNHNDRGNDFDMSVEDVSLCKRLVGELYNPLVAGQAMLMLEGQTE